MTNFKVYRRNADGKGKTFITSIDFDSAFTASEIKDRLTRDGAFSSDIIVRKYAK
jgi:type II secretory pathway component HofQ